MAEEGKTARVRFAAALALNLLWVAALAVMAVFPASRPAANKNSEKVARVSGTDPGRVASTGPTRILARIASEVTGASTPYSFGLARFYAVASDAAPVQDAAICDEPLGRSKQTTRVPPSRYIVPDLS